MSRQAQGVSSLLAIIAICSSLPFQFQIAIAQLASPPLFSPMSGDGSPYLSTKCLSSALIVHGCIEEITGSLIGGILDKLSPACCNGINGITQDCMSTMFPISFFLPALLMHTCASSDMLAEAPVEETLPF
ncbi:egg cell-secreted protein 1.4-like [Tripterygium wilfordii]|uniref:Egg cell-secreted protein 1.4-like n=1 Tax=Tripterygium wilfordii TaxID=458696 RepID=A0A7J7DS24_TRIWF|nr:uncharacterized protein LOC119996879 [Tripterygium wilfordii]KAF5749165.1 egg cell-secreted protein 1.4-like [Tripterygium wilfordii]